jgi:hypothetical protein
MRQHHVDSREKLAEQEHAFLLRQEGLTFKQIGGRLGVTAHRARMKYLRFCYHMNLAIRHARWEMHR